MRHARTPQVQMCYPGLDEGVGSKKIVLRQINDDDVEELYRMNSDPVYGL